MPPLLRPAFAFWEILVRPTFALSSAQLRNCNQFAKGIGIDEYEDTPPAHRDRMGRPTHNTKVVRRFIVNHLCEELQTVRRNIFSALKAVRIATRQALHEGWLPC